MPVSWHIQTPTASPGAVAVVQLIAGDPAELETALAALKIKTVAVGGIALRDLCGIDRGLVARWSESSAWLMPHGGAAVIRALVEALERAGMREAKEPDPRIVYPEATSEIEARMLAALARAASPLAIDVLLDQPRRWAAAEAKRVRTDLQSGSAPPFPREGAGVGLLRPMFPENPDQIADPVLQRLIDPPLVVAIGPPNIGKSSLVNALAGRSVSIVADEPGTTRDHVGVMIHMAGLVVRYVDTPGRALGSRPSAIDLNQEPQTSAQIDAAAARLAWDVAGRADLILLCGDAGAGPIEPPAGRQTLTVALRADLGLPPWPHDTAVSARTGTGLVELAGLIRERLVPSRALADPRPWRFWA